MNFLGLGGVNEIGASSYLYDFNCGSLLIDAGVRPNALGEASLPDFGLIEKEPLALLLTHAHSDHIGALPLLKRKFPNLAVYATLATATLALAMLKDAQKIGESQGAVLFSLKEVANALAGIHIVKAEESFEIKDLTITPYLAGHLIGAVSYLIEAAEGRLFHSGDINNIASQTTAACYFPAEAKKLDLVTVESTYGDTLVHVNRKAEIQRFIASVSEVLNQGGRVLIPAFAMGRSSDVALTLADHMRTKVLKSVPIVLDGLVRSIHELFSEELFSEMPEALQKRAVSERRNPLFAPEIVMVKNHQDRMNYVNSKQAMIIIASSGMLNAGVSPLYAKAILAEEKSLIAFVGYQDEGAPGKQLLQSTEGKREIALPTGEKASFENLRVNCQIDSFSFSGHADANGLISLTKRYNPDHVIVIHGEANARMVLKDKLAKAARVHLLSNSEKLELNFSKPDSNATETNVEKAINTEPKRRTKMIRYKTRVKAKLEGKALILEFADDVDVEHLLGDIDSFTIEFARAEILRMKLTGRPK